MSNTEYAYTPKLNAFAVENQFMIMNGDEKVVHIYLP